MTDAAEALPWWATRTRGQVAEPDPVDAGVADQLESGQRPLAWWATRSKPQITEVTARSDRRWRAGLAVFFLVLVPLVTTALWALVRSTL